MNNKLGKLEKAIKNKSKFNGISWNNVDREIGFIVDNISNLNEQKYRAHNVVYKGNKLISVRSPEINKKMNFNAAGDIRYLFDNQGSYVGLFCHNNKQKQYRKLV